MNDFKFAFRQLLKHRGFTAVTVLSLALGIGASVAIFSLLNAIVLRSLPVPNPHELRLVKWTGVETRMRSISGDFKTEGSRSVAESVSPALFLDLRDRVKDLANLFAFAPLDDAVVRGREEAFSAGGMVVSDNFFQALAVQPALGRVLAHGADAREVVISHDWWVKHFGQNADAVGASLTVNGATLTIIGVLPPGFQGIRPGKTCGFYVPLVPDSPFLERAVSVADHWWVRMMARMRESATDAQLKAALETVFVPAAQTQVKQPEMVIRAGDGGLAFDREAYGKPLVLMFGAVGLVLLAACANVAGLTLALGVSRRGELSVRSALGAARGRLIRQSLAESLLLSLFGGGLGIFFAVWIRTALSRLLAPSAGGFAYDLTLDWKVLAFAATAALGTAFLCGLLPALRAGGTSPAEALNPRVAGTVAGLRAGRALVIGQVGLTLVLLTGAGIFLQALLNLRRMDAGFKTERLLVFQLNAGFAGYKETELFSFYERVQSALAAVPGVKGAALTVFPLLDNKSSSGGFSFKTRAMLPDENPNTFRLVVGESFFETLGIQMVNGRSLGAGDHLDRTKVAVVNEAFVKKYFPDQNPIGHVINTWRSDWQIVGVCRDIKYENIKQETPPTTYLSFRQFPLRFGSYFVVRTAIDPLTLGPAIRGAVAKIDPAVPIANLTTQEQLIDRTIGQERLFANVCTAFGGFALLLASIGLYGLLAFSVERRKREIAIRMAVGAVPRVVAAAFLREGLVLVAIGIAVGLPAVFAAIHLLRSQIPGLTAGNLPILCGAMAILALVGAIASLVPAVRAARVDPMGALRYE